MDTNTTEGKKFDAELMADSLRALATGVITVADVKGLTKDQLESVYRIGTTYYETGKYAEAEKVFAFLGLIAHTNTKYWTALGSARQAQKNFKGAIEAYGAAALYDLHAPKPHYYAAQCNLALGDLDFAESGCRSVLNYCPAGNVDNDRFRAKAEEMLKTIAEVRGK